MLFKIYGSLLTHQQSKCHYTSNTRSTIYPLPQGKKLPFPLPPHFKLIRLSHLAKKHKQTKIQPTTQRLYLPADKLIIHKKITKLHINQQTQHNPTHLHLNPSKSNPPKTKNPIISHITINLVSHHTLPQMFHLR